MKGSARSGAEPAGAFLTGTTTLSQFRIELTVQTRHHGPVETLPHGLVSASPMR